MIDIFNDFVGRAYEPVLDPVTGQVAAGFAGVDWPYVGSIAVAVIGIWLFFSVLYALFKHR